MGTEWEAASYERVSGPQFAWGSRVVERVPLAGDEDVLDAGCGTGRVTRLLAERVPDGTVLGVDGSHQMAEEARARLADLSPRVRVMQADLTALALPDPVDAIVSTATFHWILDHDALFRRLFAALRPGGVLVAQCGGEGNIARTLAAADEVAARDPYAAHLAGMPRTWYFAGPEATEARLARAGFVEARAGLEEADTPFPTIDEAAEFLATVVLRHHLERLPEELRGPYAREVAERRAADDPQGRVVLDYMRLNLEARRPASEPAPR
jgi:trans-aconitate 2-methyltransferase